jgi:hypothetical protein
MTVLVVRGEIDEQRDLGRSGVPPLSGSLKFGSSRAANARVPKERCTLMSSEVLIENWAPKMCMLCYIGILL